MFDGFVYRSCRDGHNYLFETSHAVVAFNIIDENKELVRMASEYTIYFFCTYKLEEEFKGVNGGLFLYETE